MTISTVVRSLVFGCAMMPALAVGQQVPGTPPACPIPTLTTIVSGPIGDVTGDAIEDIGVAEWHISPAVNIVRVVDAVSGLAIHEWYAPQGEFAFGSGVLSVSDFDSDGRSDVAIASVLPTTQGIIRVYSSVTGKQIALLKAVPGEAVAVGDVKQMGDLNEDGTVGDSDIVEAIDLLHGSGSLQQLELIDWDANGQISADELIEVLMLSGTAVPLAAKADLVTQINGNSLPASAQASYVYVNGTAVASRTRGGWIKCLWCSIKCGADLIHASECIGIRGRIADECFALYPNVNCFDYVECIIAREPTALADCIQRVAEAAGECGECVYECVR